MKNKLIKNTGQRYHRRCGRTGICRVALGSGKGEGRL